MAGFWNDIWKHGLRSKYVKSVVKHGLNSEYLSGLQNTLRNLSGKYTGSGLTDAQKESMTAEQNFNAQEAEKARQFEKEMSDTSYQRKVVDLQKAGLNPALAIGGSGAPMASGNAASASAPNPEMMDVLGLMISASQNARQMNIQKDIAMQNVGLSRRKLDAEIEMKSRELSLRERALNFEKEMRNKDYNLREKEYGLREKSTDKIIEEANARISKLAEETENEKVKRDLMNLQKRIDEADAKTKEAFAEVAKETYDAELSLLQAKTHSEYMKAKADYEQSLAIAVERGFKEHLYTQDYVDSVVSHSISEAGILRSQRYMAAREAWKEYIIQCIINGKTPSTFTYYNGNKSVTLDPPSEKMLVEMRKGLGLDGPTSQSAAWSNSKNYGAIRYGFSESGASTTHYSAGWRNP